MVKAVEFSHTLVPDGVVVPVPEGEIVNET